MGDRPGSRLKDRLGDQGREKSLHPDQPLAIRPVNAELNTPSISTDFHAVHVSANACVYSFIPGFDLRYPIYQHQLHYGIEGYSRSQNSLENSQ